MITTGNIRMDILIPQPSAIFAVVVAEGEEEKEEEVEAQKAEEIVEGEKD